MTSQEDTTVILRNGLPPPPVPQRLRDMFNDYPGHILRLQKELNVAAEIPAGSPPFEVAIWMIEGQLEEFVREAQVELEAAKASGDKDAIARADKKERLMSRACWKHVWVSDEALWDYFQQR